MKFMRLFGFGGEVDRNGESISLWRFFKLEIYVIEYLGWGSIQPGTCQACVLPLSNTPRSMTQFDVYEHSLAEVKTH